MMINFRSRYQVLSLLELSNISYRNGKFRLPITYISVLFFLFFFIATERFVLQYISQCLFNSFLSELKRKTFRCYRLITYCIGHIPTSYLRTPFGLIPKLQPSGTLAEHKKLCQSHGNNNITSICVAPKKQKLCRIFQFRPESAVRKTKLSIELLELTLNKTQSELAYCSRTCSVLFRNASNF